MDGFVPALLHHVGLFASELLIGGEHRRWHCAIAEPLRTECFRCEAEADLLTGVVNGAESDWRTRDAVGRDVPEIAACLPQIFALTKHAELKRAKGTEAND